MAGGGQQLLQRDLHVLSERRQNEITELAVNSALFLERQMANTMGKRAGRRPILFSCLK